MFIFDPLYIVVLVVTLGITGWAAWRVRSTYGKWSKVDSGSASSSRSWRS